MAKDRTSQRKPRKIAPSSRFGSLLHRMEIIKSYGDEPVWSGVSIKDHDYREKYISALNWGSAAFEPSVLKEVSIKFFKDQEEYSFLKEIPEQFFVNGVGIQCWLRSANAPTTDETNTFFKNSLEDLRVKHSKIKEEQEKVKKEKEAEEMENRKLTAEQESRVEYNDLSTELDNFICKNDVQSESIYDFLKNKTPTVASLRLLQTHYSDNVKDTDDYNSKHSKPAITVKKYVNNLRDYSAVILSQIAKILNNTKAEQKLNKVRRPRRKKLKPANMQVKNLQFKERDEGLKIVSVPPTTIVHTQALAVFNTKTRKVGMYYAKNVEGLTIKGTTIQNYDEEKSVQKTLRKPEEMLGHLTELSVRRYEKVFKDIKAVETILTGRVNSDILLLKVFKSQ